MQKYLFIDRAKTKYLVRREIAGEGIVNREIERSTRDFCTEKKKSINCRIGKRNGGKKIDIYMCRYPKRERSRDFSQTFATPLLKQYINPNGHYIKLYEHLLTSLVIFALLRADINFDIDASASTAASTASDYAYR